MSVPGRGVAYGTVLGLVVLASTAVGVSLSFLHQTAPAARAGGLTNSTVPSPPPGAGATSGPTTSIPTPPVSTAPSAVPSDWPLPSGSAVPGPALYAVSFPTTRSGYALAGGYQATDGSVALQLATTSDGGHTWTATGGLLPDANKALPSEVNVAPHLVFPTPTLGYSWDQGEVDVTQDGGAHWEVLPDPPGLSGPYRIGPATVVSSTLWVSYASYCPGLCPFGDVASWAPGVGWTQRLSAELVIHAMTATSSQVELLATPMSDAEASVGVGQFMYIGTDGGGGWHIPGIFTCPADSSVVDAMAGVSSTVLAECVGSFEAGWAARSYWLTTDNGATWTMQARDAAEPSMKAGTPPWGEGGFLAYNDGTFWIAESRGSVYGSVDNGLTWRAVSEIDTGVSDAGTVTFAGQNGWCLYHGFGLWGTTDSGSSWQLLASQG
jgi:hypothetical protein